jgi:hypothetical protein
MNTDYKKRLHHLWTKFRVIKPEYLLVALLVMLCINALALRHNYQTMTALRQDVYTADEKNGDIEGALRKLRQYIYAHMNTNMSSGSTSVYPPLQLKHTYERLTAGVQTEAKANNAQVYTAAQAYCEKLYPQSFSGGPRVPCIKDYVASHGVKVPTVPDSLYKFDFVSPRWSSDFAGWSIIVTFIVGGLLVIRVVVPFILKRLRVL